MILTPPRLDPGIPRLAKRPLFGNLLEYRRDRLGGLERVRRELGDVGAMQLGRMPVIVLSDPDLIKQMLVDHGALFVKGPNYDLLSKLLGHGLITNNGEPHRKSRQLLAPALSARRVAGYGAAMVGFAEARQVRWADGAVVDAAEEMTRLTLDVVAKTLFDLDVGAAADTLREAFTEGNRWVETEVTKLFHVPLSWPLPRHGRMRGAMKRLDEVIFPLIRERRRSGEDTGDVLSMLLLARDAETGEGLSDLQLRDELVTMLFAGHETTANALGWALYQLSAHPEVRARAEREVDDALGGRLPTTDDLPRLPFTLQVFKEAMRILPPVPVISRHAAEDVRIGPYLIAKGQLVLISIWSLHRRPDLYTDPETFDPTRFEPEREKRLPRYAYIPFAGGSRVCLGNHFALMEGHLVLATLLQRARLDLVPGHRVELEPLLTLRARFGLKMRVTRRARATAGGGTGGGAGTGAGMGGAASDRGVQ
jgi:cytochrome P450